MEYNTARNHLIVAEYGRNVQRMIEYACTIENREERNKCAATIIRVMGQINPHLRDVMDFRHKLYDHLLYISDFKLDIDSPFPKPSKESLKVKPDRVPYSSNHIRFKHYGKILQSMIDKACTLPDGEEKNSLIYLLVLYMKKSYANWNRENQSDDVIAEQLHILSHGQLQYTAEIRSAVGLHDGKKEQQDSKDNIKNKNKKFHKKKYNNGHKKL